MSAVRTITVTAEEADLRLDRWFRRRFPGLSHGRLQRLLRGGQIRVDGRRVKSGTRLAAGQAVRVPPLPEGEKLPGAGSFVVGEKGVMVLAHWSMPRFYREGEKLDVEPERCEGGNHYHEWVDACRGDDRPECPILDDLAGAPERA